MNVRLSRKSPRSHFHLFICKDFSITNSISMLLYIMCMLYVYVHATHSHICLRILCIHTSMFMLHYALWILLCIYVYFHATHSDTCLHILCIHTFMSLLYYALWILLFESRVYIEQRGRSCNIAFTHQLWENAYRSSRRWLRDTLMLVNNPSKEDWYFSGV